MNSIAEEKQSYYKVLENEFEQKFKTKKAREKIYNDKKNDHWTFYISLKRKTVKKQMAFQQKLGQSVLNMKSKDHKALKKQMKMEKEIKKQTDESQRLACMLGKTKDANVHLNKYTNKLKDLIGKLHDETLNNENATRMSIKCGDGEM